MGDDAEKKDSYFDNIKEFANKNFNWLLLGLLALAFVVRLKFMTVNAAVWWDEADYLSVAKHYGLDLPSIAAPWRSRGIELLWAVFYKLGANEWFIRFFNQLISVGGVYVAYRFGKDFFNKYVGLMAGFMLIFFWSPIFWSARISLDIYAVILWGLLALLFYHGYVLKKSKWYVFFSGVVFGAGIFIYDSVGFTAPFFAIYLLVTERLKVFKNKMFWIFIIGIVLAAAPFLMWNYHDYKDDFDNPLFAMYPRLGRTYTADIAQNEQRPEGQYWQRPMPTLLKELTQFYWTLPSMIKWPFFVGLIVGLSAFFNLFLGFDILLKGKDDSLKKLFFLLLLANVGILVVGMLVTFTGFEFEERLWSPIFPMLFAIAGYGFYTIYNMLKKYNKLVALGAVLFLLMFGSYSNYVYGKQLIDVKKDTYVQEKLAGEWIKENSKLGDVLAGCGLSVPLTYYSERRFFPYNYENLTFMNEDKPVFFVMDFYDPTCRPQEYLQKHQDHFTPAQVFFYDAEQKQPIIVIFSVKYPIG